MAKKTKKLTESLPILNRLRKRLWPGMRKQRKVVVGSMAVLIAEMFMRLLEPWPTSLVIDYVLAPKADGAETPFAALADLSPETLILLAGLGLVSVAAMRGISRYLSSVGFALVGTRLMTEVRAQLYRHVQSLSLGFHTKSRAGDMLIRVIGDVGMMRDVAVTALLPMLANVLILIGMLSMMFWLRWELALAALATTPLFLLTTITLGKKIRVVARKQRRVEGQLATTAAEAFGAIQTVQALSLDDTFADAFGDQANRDLSEGVKGKRLSARLERTADVLSAIAQALVLGLGAHYVMRGELTVGGLLVFRSYLRTSFRPVRNFAKYSARISRASAAAERVLELFDIEAKVRDLPDAQEAPPLQGAIRFEGVRFAHEPGHAILKGLDFDVPAGSRVALVGPSGGGKSTILSLVLRLHDPDRGRVLVDGHDLREYTLNSLRGQISVALQDPMLFALSVRENIAYGAPGAPPEAIEAAARSANAHDFIETLPEGYETIVGERGVSLSRGQRQRIALARCAIRPAPILLLDEPFTGLDEESRQAVFIGLEQLAERRTSLLVTHELADAVGCDLILFLERGHIVEQGTHGSLMRAAGRYASMFAAQAAESTEPLRGPAAAG
jgi:ATP-binding cassette subfamily B protein